MAQTEFNREARHGCRAAVLSAKAVAEMNQASVRIMLKLNFKMLSNFCNKNAAQDAIWAHFYAYIRQCTKYVDVPKIFWSLQMP